MDAIPMPTRGSPELSRPGLRTLLSSIATNELQGLQRIAGFGLACRDHLIMTNAVEADLTHEGTDRIESQMSLQLKNENRPRDLFNT